MRPAATANWGGMLPVMAPTSHFSAWQALRDGQGQPLTGTESCTPSPLCADMLKTCEQFPDGCIIFLDELDALATSRSTGKLARWVRGCLAAGCAG